MTEMKVMMMMVVKITRRTVTTMTCKMRMVMRMSLRMWRQTAVLLR